jgi:hypothetical protein
MPVRHYPLGNAVRRNLVGGFVSRIPLPSAGMIGKVIKFTVSLAAVATSLLVVSWIGLALLGF